MAIRKSSLERHNTSFTASAASVTASAASKAAATATASAIRAVSFNYFDISLQPITGLWDILSQKILPKPYNLIIFSLDSSQDAEQHPGSVSFG